VIFSFSPGQLAVRHLKADLEIHSETK